jgi:hypothetical protein
MSNNNSNTNPNPSGRPTGAVGTATAIKIAQIARWRICGVSIVRCAELLGMTAVGVSKICESQDYKEYEEALLNGHLSEMDKAMAGRVDVIRDQFRTAVPAACRAIVDAVTQRRDLKTALAAAREILERDPDKTLPTQIPTEQEQKQNQLPDEVLAQAVVESNEIAHALNQTDKKRVN